MILAIPTTSWFATSAGVLSAEGLLGLIHSLWSVSERMVYDISIPPQQILRDVRAGAQHEGYGIWGYLPWAEG